MLVRKHIHDGDRGMLVRKHNNGDRGMLVKKVKSSMARSLPVENLLPQYNVGSIINYLQ